MSWKLSNCRTDCDGQKTYIVNTDLSALDGLTINGIVLSGLVVRFEDCWQVTEDDTPSTLELVSYNTFFSDCNYCVCGCCTEGVPQASVCATINMSGVDLTLLGVDNVIIITFVGPTSTLVLATLTGDFTGYTLAQLLQLMSDGIDNGGSGFDGSVSGNNLIICTPADLGTTPVGSTVNVQFTPFYTLTDYILNPGHGYDCHPPDLFQDLGYTCPITGRPAYDPTRNVLYVPNEDYPTGAITGVPPNNWRTGAPPGVLFVFSEDFDNIVEGDPVTVTIPTGFSNVLYSNPTLIRIQATFGGNNYYIIGEVQSYNPATGALDLIIIEMLYNFATPINAPATWPVNPGGTLSWPFDVAPPALASAINPREWGTVNVYDVDVTPGPTFGTLSPSTPAFLEIPISQAIDSVYVQSEDAVYFLCGGAGHGGIVKVDCPTNTVVATVDFDLIGFVPANFIYNSVRQMFYINCGDQFIAKADLDLQYDKPSNIANSSTPALSDNPFNNARSMGLDEITGEIYNPGGNAQLGTLYPPPAVYVNAVMKINPEPLFNQKDRFGDALTPNGGGGSTPPSPIFFFTDYLQPAQAPCTGLLDVPNPVGFYYHAANSLLFVIRDTNVGGERELQSWDVTTGVKTQVFPMPSGSFPKKMTYQPAVNMIFVTDTPGNVFFLDPLTGLFDPSTVPTPLGFNVFSFTDDPVNFLFFGTLSGAAGSENQRVGVISRTTPSDLVSGVFVGELNCSPCLPEEVEVFVRTLPAPVKLFYQIEESQCDIDTNKKFSAGFWSKVKELKYGITSCCTSVNFESLWLDKQLTDLSNLLIPDITCIPTPSSTTCCPWLPTKACQLIPDPYGGTSIVGLAGEEILFGRVVTLNNNGKLYHNEPSDLLTYQRVVGFATQDAVINQQMRVLISGQLTNSGWSLTPGAIYYAAADGTITSSVPLSGISQVVGVASSSTTLIVEIRQPIIL